MSNDGTPELVEQVRRDHARLDDLFSELRDAIAEDVGAPTVAELFARLRTDLEVHLAREDRIYYPCLGELRPEHRRLLEALCAAHDEFRSDLATIAADLDTATAAADLESHIDKMARRFVMHESAEELLLQRIDAEL